MTLVEAIKRVISRVLKRAVYQAEVLEVDEENRTCKVKVDGDLEIDEVRLTAVIDSLQAPCFFLPKIGSIITCAVLEADDSQVVVVKFSEVDKVVLLGGNNGGLIVWANLREELKSLHSRVTAIENGITNAIPTPSDGGAALKTQILTVINANSQIPNFDNTEIENIKALH